jgi:hypothetical protein
MQVAFSRAIKPAELPVVQATKFDRLNRKTGQNLVESWPVFPFIPRAFAWRSAQDKK